MLRHAPHEVRIIGGQWRRSRLAVVDSPGLRPTPDRVRETLFNWLGQDLAGWRCVDAFAGTGALGLEAASRGAQQVVLIERDRALAARLRETIARLGGSEIARVDCADALAWLQATPPQTWDLVLLDPPFDSPMLQPALQRAAAAVRPGGSIYVESSMPLAAQDLPPNLSIRRQARAGAVHYHLLLRELPTGAPSGSALPGPPAPAPDA